MLRNVLRATFFNCVKFDESPLKGKAEKEGLVVRIYEKMSDNLVKLHLRVSLTSRSVWQGNQVSLLLVDEEGGPDSGHVSHRNLNPLGVLVPLPVVGFWKPGLRSGPENLDHTTLVGLFEPMLLDLRRDFSPGLLVN